MFYYAEIDREYLVVNTHSLSEPSTNINYVPITEEQYNNGDLVGQYYNSLLNIFEIIDMMNYMGNSNWMTHKETQMPLSTKTDNMEAEIRAKADVNHVHTEYALSDDLALLEDVINTKADTTHTHTGYASFAHTHDGYATQIALDSLSEVVNEKADESHVHTEYSSTSHTHTASEIGAAVSGHNHDSDYADINHNHDISYSSINHNHDKNYASINHSHTDYATVIALEEVSDIVSGKASTSHTHDDRYYTEIEINTKLAEKADSAHNHSGVYDVSGAAASALSSANTYTDEAIDLLSETVSNKADSSALTSHTGNTTVHITSTERTNWNSAKTHANSAHAPSNAEENQNAFSNIVVNGTTIAADSKTDTLTLVAGNNVTITPDATGDSITISSANTVYTHPTSSGNKHIPAGGSSGQILRWSADGTAVWGNDNNTTYSNATQTASGLMSDTDKTKLDGIAVGANNYTLPSAGSSLGGVKSGGDVTITNGVITVNDDSHNHVISNIDGLQSALDAKSANGHTHDDRYYTETEVDTLISSKANTSHTHTIDNITNLQSALDEKAAVSHGTHVLYSSTTPAMDGTASVGSASTVARSDHKHPTDTSRAAQISLDSHTSNKSNPHGVTLSQFGVTATAAELNVLDGITATTAELNYVDGVTSNIQTQLNGKAASSHGTHVTYDTTAPKANGTASAGTASTVSRSDHVHPLQTTVSGNAGTATKLATARTISLTGDVTGSVSFDGSVNASITATVADDSHNHIISNVDGLQTALNGKAPIFTDASGGVEYGFNASDGVNLLTQISNFGTGLHTIYSQGGVTGNPKTTESWRMIVHKTSPTIGWIMAYGSSGSVYTNYQTAANTFVGWKCIYEATNKIILWSGTAYMQSIDSNPQTITPSKPLSQCRTGWLLLWSDYDAGAGVNDSDFATTFIPKYTPTGGTWGGKAFYCDIPMYVGSDGNNISTEQRCIKPIYVHDDCIKGSYQNTLGGRNDVVLRAIYEV